MYRLCTLLECGKVCCLGDGTEVKIGFFSPKANCHPELRAPSVEAAAGSVGSVHVPVEVLALHVFATQDCVSGCASCIDMWSEKGAAMLLHTCCSSSRRRPVLQSFPPSSCATPASPKSTYPNASALSCHANRPSNGQPQHTHRATHR